MIFWLMKKLEGVEAAENYLSHGDEATTAAVKWLLEKSLPSARWGGPHKWDRIFQRKIGKLMRDYAFHYFKENEQIGL